PVQDIAVRWHNVRYDERNRRVIGDMHIMDHHRDLVMGLAEKFGDKVGNSLVSKGAVTMEGDTEVVSDILAVRSADIVSDPASTKGLFEGKDDTSEPLTILDLIEAVKNSKQGVTMNNDDNALAAVLVAVNGSAPSKPRPAPTVKVI